MKILFFIGEFNEGGAERVISILANQMTSDGFDVEILKYHNTENLYKTNEKIKINSVEENTNTRTNIFKNIIWMHKYFKNNCDVVISFLAPFNILVLLANVFNKTKIIVADRNDPNRVPNKLVIRKLRDLLYKKADKVVVQTKDNREYFNFLNNVEVISNPIVMKEVKKALATKKKNRIVSVGRLEKQKNHRMLIEAFNDFHKKNDDYTLTIYGEGSLRKELETLVSDLKLTDCVYLPGNCKDIFDNIVDAKLFVLSSDYEGMPNALIEAMCLGLPCVTTNVSGTKEFIENGKNGFVIDTADKETLLNRMELIVNNDDLQESLGKEACKIYERLQVKEITSKWEDIIK